MTAEISQLPDSIRNMGDTCLVMLQNVSDGQLVTTAWLVPQSFTDVRDQLAALYGRPMADLVASADSIGPAAQHMMADPDTHISFSPE